MELLLQLLLPGWLYIFVGGSTNSLNTPEHGWNPYGPGIRSGSEEQEGGSQWT